jgi:hypothetical protein
MKEIDCNIRRTGRNYMREALATQLSGVAQYDLETLANTLVDLFKSNQLKSIKFLSMYDSDETIDDDAVPEVKNRYKKYSRQEVMSDPEGIVDSLTTDFKNAFVANKGKLSITAYPNGDMDIWNEKFRTLGDTPDSFVAKLDMPNENSIGNVISRLYDIKSENVVFLGGYKESINTLRAHIRENTPLAMRHEFRASYDLQHGYNLFMRALTNFAQHLKRYHLITMPEQVQIAKGTAALSYGFSYAWDNSLLSSVYGMFENVFQRLAKLSPKAASFDIKVNLANASVANAISKEFNHTHTDDGVNSTVDEKGNLCISVDWIDENSLDATAASMLKKAAFVLAPMCGILDKMAARHAFGYNASAYPY